RRLGVVLGSGVVLGDLGSGVLGDLGSGVLGDLGSGVVLGRDFRGVEDVGQGAGQAIVGGLGDPDDGAGLADHGIELRGIVDAAGGPVEMVHVHQRLAALAADAGGERAGHEVVGDVVAHVGAFQRMALT